MYYAPSVAFDGEGNIVLTWTATGMLPCLSQGVELPLSAVFYSKYTTSGAVLEDYDQITVALGFNSSVAVNDSGTMILAWNTFDIFSFKIRVNAALFAGTVAPSEGPLQLGVRSAYTPSAFVDTGNTLLNTGIDIAYDSEGDFFVTWGGSNLFSNHVYLKEIDSSGGYLSNELQVSQGVGVNYAPSIATDSQGNIIVVWNKVSPVQLFTSFSAVYARRYDNNLQALGDEFKVNLSY